MEFVEVYETSAHPELASIVHEKLNAEVSGKEHLLRQADVFLSRQATVILMSFQGFPDANVVFSPSGVQFLDEIFRAESVAFKQTKVGNVDEKYCAIVLKSAVFDLHSFSS